MNRIAILCVVSTIGLTGCNANFREQKEERWQQNFAPDVLFYLADELDCTPDQANCQQDFEIIFEPRLRHGSWPKAWVTFSTKPVDAISELTETIDLQERWQAGSVFHFGGEWSGDERLGSCPRYVDYHIGTTDPNSQPLNTLPTATTNPPEASFTVPGDVEGFVIKAYWAGHTSLAPPKIVMLEQGGTVHIDNQYISGGFEIRSAYDEYVEIESVEVTCDKWVAGNQIEQADCSTLADPPLDLSDFHPEFLLYGLSCGNGISLNVDCPNENYLGGIMTIETSRGNLRLHLRCAPGISS